MPFSRGFLQGAQYEDSDSSRGEDLPGELGSGNSSNSSTANDRTVADLTRTCSNLQTQVLLAEILKCKSLVVQVEQLQQENALLKQQLQNHGIIPQVDRKYQFALICFRIKTSSSPCEQKWRT